MPHDVGFECRWKCADRLCRDRGESQCLPDRQTRKMSKGERKTRTREHFEDSWFVLGKQASSEKDLVSVKTFS